MLSVTIDITTESDLTPHEQAILNALAGNATTPVSAPAAKPEPVAPVKAPAKKAAAPKAEPVVEEGAVAEEPAAEEEPSESVKLEQAVKIATGMINDGKQADLKAALTDVGAKRVSELAGDALDAFLAANAS